ncbi:hypothetical protein X874_5700 [Mannheimia varigena USDA-ARS-USMARC-1312]|uniref:Uncharacterized protein n=1 Tax=Mannheimia varigena USDA-ARS-USMARC-1296 TaxID=1433287 RepID=W0Q858_9PAST|nr:hypothetical protein X808_5560 [Mannheimia varigena USDA-ARS-USMARC-1296]AHG77206.1 hypothetical protein X874_5700 [Mannheimia varigena USDA-ARS-USMARC-1312]AHG80135.1 hypothetical protein X875_15170 [Mannheimia varigena USDA-ARS-USMARC-1388]
MNFAKNLQIDSCFVSSLFFSQKNQILFLSAYIYIFSIKFC